MNTRDLIALCTRNLLRRRTRTVLAVVGVVVGVCAIIVMLSIGFGLKESYQAMISSYGNLHLIQLSHYGGSSRDEQGVLNQKTLAEIAKIDGVGAVSPIVRTYGILYDENSEKRTDVSIVGMDANVLEKFDYSTSEGSLLKKSEPFGVLFGYNIPDWFYSSDGSGWGERLDVMKADLYFTKNYNYKSDYEEVVDPNYKQPDYPVYEVRATGILSNPNDESSYSVFMDIETVELIIREATEAEEEANGESYNSGGVSGEGANKTYEQAYVYVTDIKNTESISQTLKDQGYQTYSASDWLNEAKKTLSIIEMVLGGIGGVSLLVAAIGIANTMVMSVYERTKEIGIMKVIGANLRDIRNMFLIEAGMIGLSGGLIGVVISFGLSFAMNHFLKDLMGNFIGIGGEGAVVSVIPLWLAAAALGFSVLVGVVAGLSPANKAMKASALNSLRAE